MMRPSVLYVATVSDFLSSSRTPSYGLERGCRDPIFHYFVKANFQIRVFRTWRDRGGGFNQAVPFYCVFDATECPLRRDRLEFFSFLTDAELRARAWGWSRRVFSLFSIDKRVKNAHYGLRRTDCLQMDLASTLLPVTRFLRGKKKIRDGRDEGDA